MEIFVSVHCKDKLIKIPISNLIKHEYFKNLLLNFPTKMTKTTSNSMDNNMVDIYTIPHITLECDSHILKQLLEKDNIHYWVSGDILDLLYFNGLFNTQVRLGPSSYWKGNYFYLVLYIKTNLPNVNVYDYMTAGNFTWTSNEMYHSFHLGSKNELPSELFFDLIEKINVAISYEHSVYYSPTDIVDVIGFIITCYKNGFDNELKNKVDFEPIKMVLPNYAKNSEGYVKISYDWKKNYSNSICQLYEKMEELCEFGMINLSDIGILEDYQFK